ncbi:hypothetical protein [Geothrix fuzhouensis]|uniref:hypothetical protein n=1 Tax=Geothrix fuzhouensis TaxID=2966451 RepID=UPI002148B31A|nr:hypothetical protein [Geothrix fuzhouensis]
MVTESILPRTLKLTRQAQVVIACALLVALSLWMNPQIPQRMASLANPLKQLIYLVEILAALLALVGCGFARRRWAILGGLFFSVNFLVGTSFFRIRGRPLTLVDGKTLLESVGNTGDALSQFTVPIFIVVLQILGVLALLIWVRAALRARNSLPLITGSLTAAVMYVAILAIGGDTALNGFPMQFQAGLHAGTLAVDAAARRWVPDGKAAAAFQRVPLDPAVRHLVLVIDESVEGSVFRDMVDQAHLPYLRNFGLGYSFANSSPASNLMLRRGADPKDAGTSLRHFPSLLQMAKEAGFRTAYIDCQGVLKDVAVQDYFDDLERSYIDEVVPSGALGVRTSRDLNAIPALIGQLGKAGRTFTLINKVGIHFPYAHSLPPELSGVPNPYAVAISRSSLAFLVGLAGRLPEGTLVFYTSDHGQNFQAKAPHGNLPGECSPSEWTVPVILLSSSDLAGRLKGVDPRWQDHASHALMSESIRNLLGQRMPGMPTLWSAPSPEDLSRHRAFYGSPMGLFGKPISYLTIDMDRRVFLPQSGAPAAP